MMRLNKFLPQTLIGQFLVACSLVMTLGALIVGAWVSERIETGVVQNSAVSAALYMEGFISPLSPELADENGLSEPARAALQEIFFDTALGERVVSYKIWKRGGLIAEASNVELRGKTFAPSEDLIAAWQGEISASFERLDDDEDVNEAALGIPLLEVYSPVREIWTGEIVAVAEFYERADGLAKELRQAKLTSWLLVSAVFGISGLLLFGLVRAANGLIERQQLALEHQLSESQRMFRQNTALKDRIAAAAQRSTAQADRVMQRIGQDLHDGVAQHLSLASLRFESAKPSDDANAATVRQALDAAMSELRAISRGLALPDIEQLSLAASLRRAVEDHQKAYGVDVVSEIAIGDEVSAPYPIKLCAYRFVQEALSNATRHANATETSVRASLDRETMDVRVIDNGAGFDPDTVGQVRLDGGQGLYGLQDRTATLNGRLEIESSPGQGSTLRLILPIREQSS